MGLFKKLFGEKGDNPDDGSKDIKKSPHHMSPVDLQKHIEAQMREILKSFENNYDENIKAFDENILDEFTEPEFENHLKQFFESNQNMIDIDLDGKIPAAQIETFLHRLPPNMNSQSKFRSPVNKTRNTDSEKIMDKIHGTAFVEPPTPKRNQRNASPPQHFSRASILPPPPTTSPNEDTSNSFSGNSRSFGHSIMSQTVRKPDGSYETKRIVRDSDGNSTTTITKMHDGKTETYTYDGSSRGKQSPLPTPSNENLNSLLKLDQNLMQTKDGYTIPRNLWKY